MMQEEVDLSKLTTQQLLDLKKKLELPGQLLNIKN